MKTNRVSRLLRCSALAILVMGFATWLGAGARLGWTQTSVVTMQEDEITGISYPVRAPAFRPGVEVPLVAAATAATLAGLAWASRSRREARA